MAPGDARQRLAPVLGAWGLSGQQSADALLLMSELVSNAVEHALTSARPRTRYLVGPDAKRRARLQRLPDRLRDRLLTRFLFGD